VQSDFIFCISCGDHISSKVFTKPRVLGPITTDIDVLSPGRWEKFVASILNEYGGSSIVKKVVKWRFANANELPSLKMIGSHILVGPEVLVDAYSEGESYNAPIIIGLGRNVAIREEAYLVRSLLNSISNKKVLNAFTAEGIKSAITELGITPNVVFIPIKYHKSLHINPPPGIRVSYDKGDTMLEIDRTKVRVFWSNVYIPFEELIFVDQRLGEWVVSGDDANWLKVERKEERVEKKFDVTIRTIAEFFVKDNTKGLVLAIGPSPSETDAQ
jgi:hypothetical protein